jgi:hypothetical protein
MMKTSSLFTFSALMLAVPAVALAQAGSTTGQGSTGSSGQTGASDTMSPGTGTGSGTMGSGSSTGQAQAQELIGADVKNAQNETIGEIESVHLDQSGMVSNIIVSVGGFLGLGSRDVALSWNDLQVAEGGQSVTTTMTKEQLKSLPEYQYSDSSQRGKVFSGANTTGGSGTQGGARSGSGMQRQ